MNCRATFCYYAEVFELDVHLGDVLLYADERSPTVFDRKGTVVGVQDIDLLLKDVETGNVQRVTPYRIYGLPL